MDNIGKESNVYAKQVMGDIKYESWTKIKAEEVKAYFGFILLMGMVPLPSLEEYWKRDLVFHYLSIADYISRDHFWDISRYLHIVNNSTHIPLGQPGHDCLEKVWPVIDHLFQRFSDLYMPMKPIKRGIKVWVLGDSHNGDFHKFRIYFGNECTREVNLGARVVKTLTNHLIGKFHHKFLDNFFTTLKFLHLEVDGLYGCQTVCEHCIGFLPTLKTLKLINRYNAFK